MNDLLIHSPDLPAISDVMDLQMTVGDTNKTAPLILEEPVEWALREAPARSLFQRIAQGRGASPVAFLMALLVHVGLIFWGFAYYKSVAADRAAELVLPRG